MRENRPSGHQIQRRCPLILFFPLLLLLLLRWELVAALKCKCTQNSPKVPCEHGVCQVPSSTSACLMLDHPHSGRHYACSTSDLKEGECVEKQSKSGANVKVCSCNSSDFCNFKIWPDGKEQEAAFEGNAEDEEEDSSEGEESPEANDGEATAGARRRAPANGATTLSPSPLRLPPIPLLLLLLIPLIPTFHIL